MDNNELYYKTDWKTSGGKLTVAEDGKSAAWKAEQSSAKDYTVTVTIELLPKSGKRLLLIKLLPSLLLLQAEVRVVEEAAVKLHSSR